MAFHSLKNQTFRQSKKRERQSERRKRGCDKRGRKRHSGSRRHRDMGEVQIKNERRKMGRVGKIGGVRKE